ncbi:unnamed protein product [Ambrosiozyma monospora]|uniref:Unnamed protein product n=1 Tax=Ambrosiozyma monospora TaxID=43982 RepID=A0ACB5T936_AMBMO|nr:unnamed protein product [Ambrosiozyma monospora]
MVYSASMASHQLFDYTNTDSCGPSIVQQPTPFNNLFTQEQEARLAAASKRFAASHANSGRRTKRRNSESESSAKKVKQTFVEHQTIPTSELTLENINLDEYPKFFHPDGGFIQFTPLGNIRTFMSDNNVMQRVIEKKSTFDINNLTHGIDGYTLYLGNSGFEAPCKNVSESSDDETENYMRNGYNNIISPSSSVSCYNDSACGVSCRTADYYDADSDIEEDEDMF